MIAPRTLFATVAGPLAIGLLTASPLAAQSLTCNLGPDTKAPGLVALLDQGQLTVSWNGASGTELRAHYGLNQSQPVVRELAVRKAGGVWSVLGRDLTPEFTVQTGRRRVAFSQLPSLSALGVDVSSREVLDREAWFAFWDAPFVVPGVREGDKPMNPDLPRRPEEIRRATATFTSPTCDVKADGARIEVNFAGLSMGIFSGSVRFTHYRGTNLLRVEAIAKTDENLVAYKYDGGLKGFSTGTLPRVRWMDTPTITRASASGVYMPHPRTKGSTHYPDAVKDDGPFDSDHYRGAGWRWGMGSDLSEVRMSEKRVLPLWDEMNNWMAAKNLRPKYLMSITETYGKNPGDDIYANGPVTYLKLDTLPTDGNYTSIIDVMMKGDYFVTSGEVLIPTHSMSGSGANAVLNAEVHWTFPLDFVEVVWGDGQKTSNLVVSAKDLAPFANKTFAIPFNATGAKWVRFAAWDTAGNGAMTQPRAIAAR